MNRILFYLVVIILAGFGLLTLFLSSSIILDLYGIREKEGNYVLFIVWANFISSIIYLVSVYGLLKSKPWTYKALATSAIILALAFAGLLFYINSGGIYEKKTVAAMIFRTTITLGFTLFAYFSIGRKSVDEGHNISE